VSVACLGRGPPFAPLVSREAFSRAAQTLRTLAEKIGYEGLGEGFLSALGVRRAF